MDSHRRVEESSSNQFSHTPSMHIPPPPLPPRFLPPNISSGLPLIPPLSVPPPSFPPNPSNYPPFPGQLHPPARGNFPLPSWENTPGHPCNYPAKLPPPNRQFLQNSGNANDPLQHFPPPFRPDSSSPMNSLAHVSQPITQERPPSQGFKHSVKDFPHRSQSHYDDKSVPSWGSGPVDPSTSLNLPPPIKHLTEDTQNAQAWVDQWARNKNKLEASKCDVKIYEIKEKLNKAFQLVRELENSSRTLGVMVKTVSSEEWEKKCQEVEENKKKLTSLFKELNLTEEEFKCLREKISKRSKKRSRLRRQSNKRKKQKEEEKVKEQNVQVKIDNWQREMQERVERVKREEDLKKEADAVLWGVTQKTTEAKRQVAMLAALLNLRSARVARLTAAGLPVSQSQIDTFNTVIERLKSMWSRYLEECRLEEQTLRGMLSSQTSDSHTSEVTTYRRLVLNEWEAAIFGAHGASDTSLAPDEMINVRFSWDRFAVREPSLTATAVPSGYVLPVSPSSELWRSFLKY